MEAHSHDLGQDPVESDSTRLFRDLRKQNEYGARVARMLEAKRRRRIMQVIEAQRRHRTHQSR